MFNWFLKLLGIDENRPTSSSNSYLNTPPASSTEKEPEVKSAAAPVPAASKPAQAPEKAVAESAPAAEEAAPPAESLTDAFPSLKANYAKVLEEAGFSSRELIDKAADKDLLALKGIGKATLKILRS